MNNYFKRQIELWGEETQELLSTKKIAIIGCGGLGSTLGITLGSSGIGEIHLVDFDTVSLHNIHRQIAFTLDDVDAPKCEILAALISSRSDLPKLYTYSESFEEFSKKNINIDLIIDATDNLPSRAMIDTYAKSVQTPWLYASVEEFNGQVCFFEKSSFTAFNITDRKPGGIAPPIVAFIASFEANIALRYLAGLAIEKDVLNYLYFDKNGSLNHKKFNMPA